MSQLLTGNNSSRRCPRRGSCRAGFVTDAAHRHHNLRMLWVGLDLRAESLHMHVNEPGVRGVPVTPYGFEQGLTAEHCAGLASQRNEQVELQRSQRDPGVAPAYLMCRNIDRGGGNRPPLGWGVIGATQPRPDAGDPFLGLERLDDVVVRAGLETEHDI